MERLREGAGVATDLGELQSKLWEAADQLRANSGLKASEYAAPVLGLIFLRYADGAVRQGLRDSRAWVCSQAHQARGLPSHRGAVPA